MKEKINLYFVLSIVLLAGILNSCSKSSFPTADTTIECNGKLIKPILNPKIRPDYPGGMFEMMQFLKDNFKRPAEVADKDMQGVVRIVLTITKEGDICDVRITSKPIKYIDDEYIRVFKKMPKWAPALNNGEYVDSYFMLDIKL